MSSTIADRNTLNPPVTLCGRPHHHPQLECRYLRADLEVWVTEGALKGVGAAVVPGQGGKYAGILLSVLGFAPPELTDKNLEES